MKLELNKQYTTILSILLFSIATMMSSNALAAKPFSIGHTGPAGGIVFHVTDDGKHGLEAAQNDQSNAVTWGDAVLTNAAKEGINGGSFNTDRIISALGYPPAGPIYAALVAANYNGGGYGDWYLPSIGELALMYNNLHLAGLGGFANDYYWSSSEVLSDIVSLQDFTDGFQYFDVKSNTLRVRAVRAF